jgi:hypothetical protein
MDKKSYVAGIIDGEGTITLSKPHSTDKYRVPVISVSSTTYELVEFLKSEYGGTISKQKVYKAHHKQSWSWSLQYDKALQLMMDIQNILLVPQKIARVKLLLTKYKNLTRRNGKYTEAERLAKLQFEADFFKLT